MNKMWDILASLYFGKCTFQELCKRDFLNGTCEYGVDIFLRLLLKRGLVKESSKGVWGTTKEAKKELADRGYFA